MCTALSARQTFRYSMSMSRVMILGVPLDPVTKTEAVARIHEMLASAHQFHVMTPNSEMLVEASSNQSFKDLMNRTALNLPDSAGLLWAAKYTKQHLPERVTGVDTVITLSEELTKNEPIFLLGAAPGVAEKAGEKLQRANPHLNVVGTYAGSPNNEDAQAIVRRINASDAKLLMVAYGAPAQDMWIDTHLKEMPKIRVAMGIGGTFDFIAGTKKRAPKFMQNMKLEWLWRLLHEPKRLPRIWNAVVVFPLKVLRDKY